MGEVRGAECIICAENYNQLNIYNNKQIQHFNKHFKMLIHYCMVLSFDIINTTELKKKYIKILHNYNVSYLIFMSKWLNSFMLILFIEIDM